MFAYNMTNNGANFKKNNFLNFRDENAGTTYNVLLRKNPKSRDENIKKTAGMGEQSSISAILCDQNHFITTFMLVTKLILLTKIILMTKIFAPSFRNDSHISSRNEQRDKGSFRKDDHLLSQNEKLRGHIEKRIIHHFKGTAIPFERTAYFRTLRELF